MRVRRPGRPLPAALLAVGAASLLLPVAAIAHETGVAHHGESEAQLRAEETRTLGPEHAAEHAAERAALRAWAARPAAERRAIEARGRRAATRATASAGPADEVGRWSTSTVGLPTWAINTVVLPTGKIAYWGRGPLDGGTRRNTAPFFVLDPATGVSHQVDPPQETIDVDGDGQADDVAPAPIFCSGQSLLPSGELFVAGGNEFYPYYGAGHADYGGFSGTYTFDPWTEKWTVQPRMRHGRWYPTQAALPDGRTAIVSGYDEHGDGADDADLEVFTPGAERGTRGTLTRYPAGEKATQGFYPHMQTLPGGLVAFVGQYRGDTRTLEPSALEDPSRSPWVPYPNTIGAGRVGGASALLPGTSRMMLVGGYGQDFDTAPTNRVFAPATRTVESMDFASSAPSWQTGTAGLPPDLNRARSYGTLVQLPDGGFAYVGGAAGYDDTANGPGNNAVAKDAATPGDQGLKAIELWKPGQAAWRTGPAQAKWRGYHSTAVLLPDGRVLSAGDDYWGTDDAPHQGTAAAGKDQDTGEVYEPAYLFDGEQKAPRPAITSGPSAIRWGQRFGVGVTEVPDRPIVRATLVAPSAVTHSVDMNRAFADLQVQRVPGKGVDLVGPSGDDVAPPGWYMLFAWDSAGTPSVARWVQVRADAPDAPVLGDPPAADPGTPSGGDGGTATAPVAPPSTGAPQPGPVARDRVGPRAAFAVRRVTRRSASLRIRVGADEPGRIAVRLKAGADPTRKLTVHLPSIRLGTLVRVPLKARARRTLRAGRTLRIVLRSTATDTSGNVARRTVVVRLKPARR